MAVSQDHDPSVTAVTSGQSHTLPAVLPGHWESDEGHQMATAYAAKTRADLALPEATDLGLANALYLVSGEIAIQTAAKERMRWLSVQLAIANASRAELLGALKGVVRLSEMGFEESLREPEENGNFAAYERAVAAITKAQRYEARTAEG